MEKIYVRLTNGTQLRGETYTECETIEQKVERLTTTNEPINDSDVTMIYTDRKDGVLPEYDVRTDKWEVAITGMDSVHKAYHEKLKAEDEAKNNDNVNGGAPVNTSDNNK